MRVRLVKKYAEKIDGVDLTGHVVGACLQVGERDAQLLIAEGWAVPAARKNSHPPTEPTSAPPHPDRHPRSKVE